MRRSSCAVRRLQLFVRNWPECWSELPPESGYFLYFTGHGGFVRNRGYNASDIRLAPQRLHYFLTIPEAGGREQALFDVELSLWCARLAAKTPNVVVVVDSCFSSGLVRDGEMDQEFLVDFEAWRHVHQDEIDGLDVEAHPDVIRLAAAGVNGFAQASASGSALTTGLLAALAAEGALQSSWLALFAQIEVHMARAGVAQHPRISGPIRRRVFTLEEALPPGGFAVRTEGGRVVLMGGVEQGVVHGDVFLVTEADRGSWAEIDQVGPTSSTLHGIERVPGTTTAFAVPLYLSGHGGVAVTGRRSLAQRVEEAVTAARWQVVAPGDAHLLATIDCDDAAMTVRSRDGERSVEVADPADCVAMLTRFARLERLQNLGGMAISSMDLRVSWGRVRDGVCERLSGSDIMVDAGDPLYVRVANVGLARRFVSVFWISDDGEAAQLSRSESMGVELAGKTTYMLGDRHFALRPRGIVPPRRPFMPGERRGEQLVIVATNQRQALWSFDTSRIGGSGRRTTELASTEILRFTVTTLKSSNLS